MVGDLDRVIVERTKDGYEAKAQIYCAGYITIRSEIGDSKEHAIEMLYKSLRREIALAEDFIDMIACGFIVEKENSF